MEDLSEIAEMSAAERLAILERLASQLDHGSVIAGARGDGEMQAKLKELATTVSVACKEISEDDGEYAEAVVRSAVRLLAEFYMDGPDRRNFGTLH